MDAMGRPASGHWKPSGLLQAVSHGLVDLSCPGVFLREEWALWKFLRWKANAARRFGAVERMSV